MVKICKALFFLLLSTAGCFAQTTFSASSLPQPGTVHRFLDGSAVNFPSALQGTNWAFSTSQFLQYDTSVISYRTIPSVPESQFYPQANMVKQHIRIQAFTGIRDTLFYFYRFDDTGLYFQGTCRPGQQPPYPFIRETIEFPLPLSSGSTIIQKDTSDVYYMSSSDSTWQRSYVTRKFEVVSSGNLTMFGNTHQVLAMKYTYSYIDSVFTFNEFSNTWNFSFVGSNSAVYNNFLSAGLGAVVLKGEYYNTEGPDDWTISAILNPPATTRVLPTKANEFTLYPNPGKGLIQIKTDVPEWFQCKIIDANGREVYSSQVDSLLVSADHLPSGEYTMLIYTADRSISFSRKIIIRQ